MRGDAGLGLLVLMVAFTTSAGSASGARAAPASSRGRAAESDSTATCDQNIAGPKCLPRPSLAAEVAHRAWHVDGKASVTQAMLSAGLQLEAANAISADHLSSMGFVTALDLQLLAGGPESAVLMSELTNRGVSIADRAKIRLLVRDLDQLGRLTPHRIMTPDAPILSQEWTTTRRGLQVGAGTESGGGVSMDTLAIALSVLVGAAGYVVQVGWPKNSKLSSPCFVPAIAICDPRPAHFLPSRTGLHRTAGRASRGETGQ
eukprot:SAG31_NODE_3049_length_4745_cov_3.873870_5_plen_260_part_00